MITSNINQFRVGDYMFFPDGVIQMPDGETIDGNKIIPISIGIMPSGDVDKPWSVMLLTQAALYKYREKITENIETVGFHFRELDEALIVQNILSVYYFKKIQEIEDASKPKEENTVESNDE